MKVQVLIQGGTEAVNEGHRPEAGRGTATGAVFAQSAFHRTQQDRQDDALQGRVALQEIAQPLGYAEHPLPQRQRRQDVIGQMRGRFHHAPRVVPQGDLLRGTHGHTPRPLQEKPIRKSWPHAAQKARAKP